MIAAELNAIRDACVMIVNLNVVQESTASLAEIASKQAARGDVFSAIAPDGYQCVNECEHLYLANLAIWQILRYGPLLPFDRLVNVRNTLVR